MVVNIYFFIYSCQDQGCWGVTMGAASQPKGNGCDWMVLMLASIRHRAGVSGRGIGQGSSGIGLYSGVLMISVQVIPDIFLEIYYWGVKSFKNF